MAGTASSLAGTLRFGTGSVIGAVVAAMPSGVAWPMIFVMAGCSVLSVGFLLDLRKKSVVSDYYLEIQNVVNSALAELDAEHRSGKLVNAPVANNHFLVHWVTKALKANVFIAVWSTT